MIDVSKIKISEFKRCYLESPTEEGHYLVFRLYGGRLSYASELYYIPGYGWNVYKDCITGEVDVSARMDFDDKNYEYFWCTITLEEENNGTE